MNDEATASPIHVELEFPGSWGPANLPVACVGGLPLVVVVRITLRSSAHAGAPVRASIRGDSVTDRLPDRVGAALTLRLEGDTLPYGWQGWVSMRVRVGEPPTHEERLTFEAEGVR